MATRDRQMYKEWLAMSQKQRERLYLKALNGDKSSLSRFRKISTSIRKETNMRIRELTKARKNYGKAFDNLEYYLQVEQDMTRVPTMSELNNDIESIMTVNTQASKFLKSKYSDVAYRRYVDNIRIKNIENKYSKASGWDRDIFEGYTQKQKEAFLKWLDTEQASYALDEYGTSEEVVMILADAFHESGATTSGIKSLNTALAEFEAGEISFDAAMQKVGVSISDRHSTRLRPWMLQVGSAVNGNYKR